MIEANEPKFQLFLLAEIKGLGPLGHLIHLLEDDSDLRCQLRTFRRIRHWDQSGPEITCEVHSSPNCDMTSQKIDVMLCFRNV